MSKDTQSEVYTKRKRGINEVGHWQMPLDGHGLAYFDELTVAYRTIPSHGVTEDPWARAAAKAAKEVQDAAAALDAAEKMDAPPAPAPGAAAIVITPAEAKAKLVATAKAKLEETRKIAALMTGAVDSKLAAAAIIEELLRKKELLDRVSVAESSAQPAPNVAVWNDILIFESALLRMLWLDALKAKARSLRQEFREVMGATAAAATEADYLDLKEMKDDKDLLRLQAEASNLMTELHYNLVSTPQLEWQKSKLTLVLGGYTLLVGLAVLVAFLRAGPPHEDITSYWQRLLHCVFSLHFSCTPLCLVMLAGTLGAGVSAFQRIQNGGAFGASLLNLRDAKWHSLSIAVVPLLGAISALLLVLLFAGGVISGAFFPKVTLRAGSCGITEASHTGTNAPILESPVGPGVLKTSLPPVAVSNIVNLTNIYWTTNHLTSTNTPVSTNATTDPATWRDCEAFCQHRWCFGSGADIALLLVWAFIAGFSERLVPDLLSRLAKKAEEKV